MLHFVVGTSHVASLLQKSNTRVTQAFHPKKQTVVQEFCWFLHLYKSPVDTSKSCHNSSLLQFLVTNNVYYHNVSLEANFIMYGLDHSLIEHQKVKNFLKPVKINRPLAVVTRNIIY